MTGRPLLLAHRGDHRVALENSVEAFRAAVDAGCNGAELDVRRSRDGVAVVSHDATLDRLFGRPEAVAGLTAALLSARGIPTLQAALEAVRPDFLMDVELKEAAVVEAAIEAIAAVRGLGAQNAVVSSFSRTALERIAGRRPTWPRWLISSSPGAVADAAELGCAAVALRVDAIDEPLVADAHRRGLLVVAWTIRDAATRDRVTALGVDWVCVEGQALVP